MAVDWEEEWVRGSLTTAPSAIVRSLQNFPKNTKMWGQLGWGHIYQDYCRAEADKLKLCGGAHIFSKILN